MWAYTVETQTFGYFHMRGASAHAHTIRVTLPWLSIFKGVPGFEDIERFDYQPEKPKVKRASLTPANKIMNASRSKASPHCRQVAQLVRDFQQHRAKGREAKPQPKPRMDDAARQAIVKALIAGRKQKVIADEFGISLGTIFKIRRKAGIPPKPKIPHTPEPRRQAVVKALRQGSTVRVIAEELGVSSKTICKIRRKAGI